MTRNSRPGTTERASVGLLATSMLLASGLSGGPGAALAPPRVFVHNQVEPRALDRALEGGITHRLPHPVARPATLGPSSGTGDPVCDGASVAWHGQPLPGGEQGTLSPLAFFQSTTLNDEGRIAFYALVDGADRNQGIFTADEEGLQVVALGCGGAGGSGETAGCGDLSPVGGTFSGFFGGTFFVPDINDSGDVLFVADIHEGDVPRGLFLYRGGTGVIEKVAAVGDSLAEGVIAELGSGNLNNDAVVVFAAKLAGAAETAIFLWDGTTASQYAAVGDPAPGGGVFSLLVSESLGFPDGTSMPGGPLPGLNDEGQITFRSLVDGGEASRGIFLSHDGVHEWLVRAGEPVPGGGTYFDFQAALLNDAGETAFFADIQEGGDFTSAWIAGSPGKWRRAVAFFDEIGDAVVWGMAFSRNPMSALNDEGDLLLWIDRLLPDETTSQAMILSRASGERLVVAGQGEPTPQGGTYGSMDAWPALNDVHQGHVGAGTPGLPGQLNTHFVLTLCSTGGLPVLGFDPSDLDFGDVEVGITSPPQLTTLSNTGDADASGLTFDPPGGGFDADTSACGDTLPAGESCEVGVTFSPTESGPAEAVLSATSDDVATASLDLVGNGVGDEGFTAMALHVDSEGLASDGNGVFEPGEQVEAAPVWRNDGGATHGLTGTATDFQGPGGAAYTLVDDHADYGSIEPGEATSCQETGLCYRLGVDSPTLRPATHWEATFEETLSDSAETARTWILHIGDSFVDVPRTNGFYSSVETLLHHGITGGCSGDEYCPAARNTRAQMPVFVLRALEGSGYVPPACVEGSEVFGDVPASHAFCPWIEELASRGMVSGCGGGNYCPNAPVTRAQMSVFLLRTLEGSGYMPPACTGLFVDVPCPSSTFADWIEELYTRGITGGCGSEPLRYCPANPVNRQQMAAFVSKTFGLTLYGP